MSVAGSSTCGYASGNMNSRNGSSVSWHSCNLPNTIIGPSSNLSQFFCDPDQPQTVPDLATWMQFSLDANSVFMQVLPDLTADQVNAVADMYAGIAGSNTYGYDANGNMNSRNGLSVTWYSYNMPNTINGPSSNSSQFFYGPDRARWKQVASYGGTSEQTIYVGGLIEKVTLGADTHWKHYIAGSTGVVAEYIRHSTGTNETVYLLKDHLGSTEMITNSSGAQMSRLSYDSWGRRRNGGTWNGNPAGSAWTTITNTTRHGFTSHEMLDNLSLVNMNGRVYDQIIGRFMSADPFIDGAGSTQGWNRYAYMHGNPLNSWDPSGFGDHNNVVKNCQNCDDPKWDMVANGYGSVQYGAVSRTSVWTQHGEVRNGQGEFEYSLGSRLILEITFLGGGDQSHLGGPSAPGPREPPGGPGGPGHPPSPRNPDDPEQPQEDPGKCWNGAEGNFGDLLGGLGRQVGNDASDLGGLLNPFSGVVQSILYGDDPFGANNTNMGQLGADLAPAVEVVAGGFLGLEAAGTRGAGIEFSHWIPARMGGPRGILNGNFVPRSVHALSDPFRYRFMPRPWKAANPMPSVVNQQFTRIPTVLRGAAAGSAGAANGGC